MSSFRTFDITGADAEAAYPLLAGVVAPRPIALVSTVSPEGIFNVAPFSFFNIVGASPPVVVLGPGDRPDGSPKDTARNIRTTREFVVNLVDESLAQAMNLCAASLPPEESEFDFAGLTPAPSAAVTAPRIAEAAVSLECREWTTLHMGDNRIVLGEILRLHLRNDLVEEGKSRVRFENWAPIGRMGHPSGYCRTTDRFELIRPA